MAIELRFVKGDSSKPWGFRLTGGAEYDEPISVVKVNPGSLAEIAGLQVGDIVARVNDTPFAGLTHVQAHDIITAAGNEFVLAVRRDEGGGLLFRETDVTEETISNAEVTSILQTSAVSVEQQQECSEETSVQSINAIDSSRTGFIEVEITIKDHQDVYATEEETATASTQAALKATSMAELKEICEVAAQTEVSAEIQSTTQERKWSTFLQKPKGAKPKPKKTEPEGPKGEPYRVVIKKQKKKEEQQHENQLQQQEFVAEVDIASTSNGLSGSSQEAMTVEIDESELQEYHAEHHEQRHKEDFELDVSITTQVQEETYVEVETEADVEAAIERACRETTSFSVEEQLTQVQKQLQQLSQLPSAIQATLDAVTKQLATIVANGTNQQKEETVSISDEDEITELVTTTDGGLTTVDEEEEVKSGMHQEIEAVITEDTLENRCEEIDSKEENGGKIKESGYSELLEMEGVETPDLYAELTEEEKEAKREEEFRLAKVQKDLKVIKEQQQRRLEQRPTQPLTPLQRPIILPGGRRWVDPEDASRSIRRPKMTDEKIAGTLETHSEVLIGRTKGESNCWMVPSKVTSAKKINFLKYQPPPKNLDYLQRSEVYRLVHDMEPPVKGIARRPSKILSEEDYYQKTEREVGEDKKQ